jgi:hypothetical protein
MFPISQNHHFTSVFDKSNLLQVLLTGIHWNERTIHEEIQRRASFELTTDKILSEDGITNKAVHEITESSKIIKE